MRWMMLVLLISTLFTLSQVVGEDQVIREDQPLLNNAPAEGAEQADLSFWMKVKLEESQNIFAALARGDFPSIVTSAEKLKSLNNLEGFVRRGTPGYRAQLQSFEFAVDEIQQQANKKNIEGVALGFQQLTLSCVNCHKQIRNP